MGKSVIEQACAIAKREPDSKRLYIDICTSRVRVYRGRQNKNIFRMLGEPAGDLEIKLSLPVLLPRIKKDKKSVYIRLISASVRGRGWGGGVCRYAYTDFYRRYLGNYLICRTYIKRTTVSGSHAKAYYSVFIKQGGKVISVPTDDKKFQAFVNTAVLIAALTGEV